MMAVLGPGDLAQRDADALPATMFPYTVLL